MKCRNVELILYELEEVYQCKKICTKMGYDYAYIFHDMDLKEDNSDFKKAHYHFQVYNIYQKEIETWVEIFKINSARVQKINNKKSAIRYLIHADNNEKYQYNIENIISSFEIIPYFNKLVSDETNEIELIFTFIDYHKRTIGTKELINYVLDNNIWGTFRRNYSIVKDLQYEHNLLFTNRK